MSMYEKKRWTSEGIANINGQIIPYKAISEDFLISRLTGEEDGTTFTFSYIRSNLDDYTGRPVLFAWNGGPGAASIFVNIGLLAPKRVKCGDGIDMPQTAPYEMIDNGNCLLDVCDIVVVDAMGTGYAKTYSEEAKRYWFSDDHDAEAFIMTIRKWLSTNKRWNSPIYVMGESYGTIRNALIAEGAFINGTDAPLMHLSGAVMIGSALDYAQTEFPINKSVLNLPSIAAANWYWHKDNKPSLMEYVNKCDEFCYKEYLPALGLGKRLSIEERTAIAGKLSEYTGYSIEELLENNLEVEVFEYPVKGLANEGKSIGIYDARFALEKFKQSKKYDYFSDDACNAIALPAFMGAFNAIWKDELNIETDEEYRLIDMTANEPDMWDFTSKSYPPEALEKAMHRNPKFKVMFGMGLYDMLTTVGWCRYLISHYDYPPERVMTTYYDAGHMPYLSDKEANKLLSDIRTFILN